MNKQKIIRYLFVIVLTGMISLTGTINGFAQTDGGSGANDDSPYMGTGTGVSDNPYLGTGTGDNGDGEGGRFAQSPAPIPNPAIDRGFFQNLISSFWKFIA